MVDHDRYSAETLARLSDDDVVERAREVYRLLQSTSHWSADNDTLIRAWARVCEEIRRRGLPDDGMAPETAGRPG
jgi:hypothetical protein